MMALIDWLAHAARGAARQGRRPARRHDRRLLRGRHRAHHRGAGQAHRRDRPDHRLALAADVALQGGDGQGRLGDRAATAPAWPGSKGRLDPHITSAFGSGATTGKLSEEDRAWFVSRGPGDLVKQITVPTFVVEGTADTLFTLDEAITNYEILKANGVPAKMMWFCGGHGVCLTGAGQPGHIEAAVVAWLKRYVGQDANVDTGPRFEWLADDAQWRSARRLPGRARRPGHRHRLRHARR